MGDTSTVVMSGHRVGGFVVRGSVPEQAQASLRKLERVSKTRHKCGLPLLRFRPAREGDTSDS